VAQEVEPKHHSSSCVRTAPRADWHEDDEEWFVAQARGAVRTQEDE
jgi:hypothetical protein